MGIETALMAAAIGGSLVQGVSALQAGNRANKMYGAMAAQTEAAGLEQAAATRREGNAFMGRQRAQFGAMGMDPLGNALDVILNTAMENELAAQSQITNSRFEAWGQRQKGYAAKKEGQSALFKSIGNAASSAMMGFNPAKSFMSSTAIPGVSSSGGWSSRSYSGSGITWNT